MRAIIALILISIVSCKTDSEKKIEVAKKAIVTKIKESAHDWSSYESVKWGTLDSSYTKLDEDSFYIQTMSVFDDAMDEVKSANENARIWVSSISYYGSSQFNKYLSAAKSQQLKAKEALDSLKRIEETFVPRFNGYSLAHSYRIKNASGNKEISHDLYYLDTTFRIFRIEDVSTDYYDKRLRETNK